MWESAKSHQNGLLSWELCTPKYQSICTLLYRWCIQGTKSQSTRARHFSIRFWWYSNWGHPRCTWVPTWKVLIYTIVPTIRHSQKHTHRRTLPHTLMHAYRRENDESPTFRLCFMHWVSRLLSFSHLYAHISESVRVSGSECVNACVWVRADVPECVKISRGMKKPKVDVQSSNHSCCKLDFTSELYNHTNFQWLKCSVYNGHKIF